MGLRSTLRKGLGFVGDVGKKVAPAVALFNPIIGAGLGAASGALGRLNDADLAAAGSGSRLRQILGGTAKHGAIAGAAGVAGAGVRATGALARLGPAGRMVGGAARTAGKAASKAAGPGGSNLVNVAKKGVGYLAKNPELAVAAFGAAQSARAQGKADNTRNAALEYAMNRDKELAPLRAAAIARLAAMGGPTARDPNDPYARG